MKNKKCPNCGQYKLQSYALLALTMGIIFSLIGTLLMFVLIGIPILFFGVTLVIIAIVMMVFKIGGARCQNCHATFSGKEYAKISA